MATAITFPGVDVVAEWEEEMAGSPESRGRREITFAQSDQKVGQEFGSIATIGYGC
jgi:hypothetical protein